MLMKKESPIEKLKRLAREAKEGKAATPQAKITIESSTKAAQVLANLAEATPVPSDKTELAKALVLEPEQQAAVDTALAGRSFCMTGAAGTGKTTTTRNIVTQLIMSNKIPVLSISHKYLTGGSPGIVGCAFTNKAVQNIKRVMPTDLQRNFVTIHKLLEFAPVYSEFWDDKQGKYRTTMEFLPSRHSGNPLPESLRVLIIEESTMVSVELWNQLFDALPQGGQIQVILIGDIQQLPPVFGKSIFIYAMQSGMKVIELTKVHRQALDSPILALAHRVLSGKIIPVPQYGDWEGTTDSGKVKLVPWKKELSPEIAVRKVARDFLPAAIEAGEYDPFEDVILSPFNVNFGCNEINAWIGTYLAHSSKWNPDGNSVFEVIGGVHTKYFRVGDKVLWNKTEHIVTDIKVNGSYYEKEPALPSPTMDYWGNETDLEAADAMMALLDGEELGDEHAARMDKLLEAFQVMSGEMEGTEAGATSRQCSHIITVESEEFGEAKVQTSGDLAQLDLAYAITVHKSQGSEYRRVFFVTHKSQATMLFRELLYTAITRAKKELTVIGPPNLFVQGITSQRLPGRTLEEKLVSFNRWMETSKVSSTELPKGMALFTKGMEVTS